MNDNLNQEITFNETTHEYVRNNTNYISVTTLLKKFNLSANYTNIPADILQKAANRGKAIHKALENYVLTQTNSLSIPEVDHFDAWVKQNNIDLNFAKPEQLIYNDKYLVAGTLDICFYDADGVLCIADHKTTSEIHTDSVSWQLNLYNYIYCKGNQIQYYSTKLFVFHYYKGLFETRECPIIPYETIEALLQANLDGTSFVAPQLGQQPLADSEVNVYAQLLTEYKQAESELNRLKSLIATFDFKMIKSMKDNNIRNWDFNTFDVTYHDGRRSTTLDKKLLEQFLQAYGKTYDDFTIKKQSAPYINVKMK